MIIEKAEIEKFRGFENVNLDLGTHLTVIAGQNGTQKTTILGMLSQPFTITSKDNPMKDEKPLCGGSYKSAFNEKFKISNVFDLPKTHEWSLFLTNETRPFTVESIARNKSSNEIRFWRKGTRAKGSGYIQLPVIFLSLKRLFPIGEDESLQESSIVQLTVEEEKFYTDWHKKILISQEPINSTNYLESPNKNTLGINTNSYDWKQNSAGQDNISKILLAILSFKRLQKAYPSNYKGGILAIDELDATLYPASQIKLIEALRTFSAKYQIQIILTTHSLSILEKVCELQENLKAHESSKNQIKVIFLEKKNNKVKIIQDVTFNTIKNRLNVTVENFNVKKVNVFTEDKEAAIFAKALLKRRASKLKFIDCSLSCSNLIDLAYRKIPSFIFPNSLIILDGDIRSGSALMRKVNAIKNILVLPTGTSPERLLAEYLNTLDDESSVWQSINSNFTKQFCFKDFPLADIQADREKAKKWFNSHLQLWGTNATKVINPWINENQVQVETFIHEFVSVYNKFAKELGYDEIS
jgi:predicted ATPase